MTVAEPRLRGKGIERVFFVRETDAHVIALCDSAEGGRALLWLPRGGDGWDGWARPPGADDQGRALRRSPAPLR